MSRYHSATFLENWHKDSPYKHNDYYGGIQDSEIKLNAFTPLADYFSKYNTDLPINYKSGEGPHPILWNNINGNWVIDRRPVGIYDKPWMLCNSGIGSLTFYNNYDISNRSDLTGQHLYATISLYGENAVWNINGHVVSGYSIADKTYEINIYSAPDTNSDIPAGSYIDGVVSAETCQGISYSSALLGSNISISLISNPDGDAAINSVVYNSPSIPIGNYGNGNWNCWWPINYFQVTLQGMSNYSVPAGYQCGDCGLTTNVIVSGCVSSNFIEDDCSAMNGTYIIAPRQSYTANGLEGIYCNNYNLYAIDEVFYDPWFSHSYRNKYYFKSNNLDFTSTWLGNRPHGLLTNINTVLSSGNDYIGLQYYDHSHPNGIINIIAESGAGIISYLNDDGIIQYTISNHRDLYLNINNDAGCKTLGIASEVGFLCSLPSTYATCYKGYTWIAPYPSQTIKYSVFDTSLYYSGIVYYNGYLYDKTTGIITFGRIDYLANDTINIIPSGKQCQCAKKRDLDYFSNKRLWLDPNTEDIVISDSTDSTYITNYNSHYGLLNYNNITDIRNYPAGFVTNYKLYNSFQAGTLQSVYPHGTIPSISYSTNEQNIATYLHSLNDFTLDYIDYEYGKGIDLLRLTPSGENFDFYCTRWYNKPVIYHKLQPYYVVSNNTIVNADNILSPLMDIDFVGNQISNTYISTSGADSKYHIIQEYAGSLDLVYKLQDYSDGTNLAFYTNALFSGINNSIDAYYYDFSSNNWNYLRTLDGQTNISSAPYYYMYIPSTASQSGISYLRYKADGLDSNSRLYIDYLRARSNRPSPYYLLLDRYGNISLSAIKYHDYYRLPLAIVSWSGDATINNGCNYTIEDIRPAISGDGTKTGFHNIYPADLLTDRLDRGMVVNQTIISGNIIKIDVLPTGNPTYNFYYRDQLYTKESDCIYLNDPMGKHWFIVYKDDTLCSYSGSYSSTSFRQYTNNEINNITGTGLLVYQVWIKNTEPEVNITNLWLEQNVNLKPLDCYNTTRTYYYAGVDGNYDMYNGAVGACDSTKATATVIPIY